MKKLFSVLLVLSLLLGIAAVSFAEGNDAIVLKEENGAVTRGGTLVVAKAAGFNEGVNITRITDCSSDFSALGLIYEGLLTIDENGNAAEGLATEWSFGEDGMTLTLKLREDVSFTNGEKFNAEAVAKCLNYYISEECNHAFRSSDLAAIAGVDVVDEYTVCINLSNPDAALTLELAASSGYIMAPAMIDSGDMTSTAIGTGPFMLQEYKEGESMTLVRNPNYYKMGADGQPLPYLDGVKFVVMTDDTTRITNLQSGDVDLVDKFGSTTSVMIAQNADGIALCTSPVSQCYNLSSNLLYEPLQDIRVRQALEYAVNPEEIVEIAFEGFGAMSPFWTDNGKWFYSDYNPFSYDPDKAVALLKEAGYEKGLDLELAIIAREPDNTVAQLLQSQLAEVGVNLTINAMDSATWVAYVRNEHKEQVSISLTGNAGYDPAKGWTVPLRSFGDVGTGLELIDNLSALVKASKSEVNQEKRVEMIHEYQNTIMDNALCTVIGLKYTYGGAKTKVHNVVFNYYGWYELANAWLEQ